MRTSGASLAFVFFVIATGCAVETAPPPIKGDIGDTSSSELKTACNLSRDTILNSVSGGRRTAIERGFGWLDANVPYSQSQSYSGYRTDCSGFVSMCWELGTSYTTANFIQDTGEWSSLGSFGELSPADAMVYRRGSSGHIMMFVGWNDAAQTEACVLEQASTAEDMQFRARTVSSLQASGYHAIRASKFGAGSPSPSGTDPNQCYCDAQCAQYGDCCSSCPNGTGGTGSGGTGGTGGAGTGGSSGSGGQCYCDAQCAQYGDCCASCPNGTGGSSGSGAGGSAGGGQCYCDAQCAQYGDCCASCPGGSGSGGSGNGGQCYCDSSCAQFGDCCTYCP